MNVAIKGQKLSFLADSLNNLEGVCISLYGCSNDNGPLVKQTIKRVRKFYQGEVKVNKAWGWNMYSTEACKWWVEVTLFTCDKVVAQKCIDIWGDGKQRIPQPRTTPSLIHNKLLWRYIARPLFPSGTGTPVTLDRTYLSRLRDMYGRLDEFTSDTYQEGRLNYTGVSKADLIKPLRTLITAIETDGDCVVLD